MDEKIEDIYRKDGGIYMAGSLICELLGISRQLLSYHVKRLDKKDALRCSSAGIVYRPHRTKTGQNVQIRYYSLGTAILIAARVDTDEARQFVHLVWYSIDMQFCGIGRCSLVRSTGEFYKELSRRCKKSLDIFAMSQKITKNIREGGKRGGLAYDDVY